MITACATVSFRKDWPTALREAARLGFAHVDLCAIPVFDQLHPERMARDPDGQAAEIGEALRQAGVRASSFNANVGSVIDRTAEAAAKREREWRGLARVMKLLGARTASFYTGYLAQGSPWRDALAAVAATAAEMVEAARRLEVEFVIEPHFDTPVSGPEQVRALLAAIPDLRFTYDPSHFAMQDLPFDETAFILERASLVHLRDAASGRMHVRCGEGTVDIPRLMSVLRARAFPGPVVVECLPDSPWNLDDDILAVRRLVDDGR
ncbi:MAG: sugar phosphate isomerase/epimerase, partial [bacterium]